MFFGEMKTTKSSILNNICKFTLISSRLNWKGLSKLENIDEINVGCKLLPESLI